MIRTLTGLVALASVGFTAPAMAAEEAQERAAAIGACRVAIAEKAGVEATPQAVDFRRSETRGRSFNVRFAVKDAGAAIGEARCVYVRRDAKVGEVTLDAALEARVQSGAAMAER